MKIPKGWKKVEAGNYPEYGDKEWTLNIKKGQYSWRTLEKSSEMNYPIEESETIIRKED
jgi:hypothetical protein